MKNTKHNRQKPTVVIHEPVLINGDSGIDKLLEGMFDDIGDVAVLNSVEESINGICNHFELKDKERVMLALTKTINTGKEVSLGKKDKYSICFDKKHNMLELCEKDGIGLTFSHVKLAQSIVDELM